MSVLTIPKEIIIHCDDCGERIGEGKFDYQHPYGPVYKMKLIELCDCWYNHVSVEKIIEDCGIETCESDDCPKISEEIYKQKCDELYEANKLLREVRKIIGCKD